MLSHSLKHIITQSNKPTSIVLEEIAHYCLALLGFEKNLMSQSDLMCGTALGTMSESSQCHMQQHAVQAKATCHRVLFEFTAKNASTTYFL